jgi:hypothetical protein
LDLSSLDPVFENDIYQFNFLMTEFLLTSYTNSVPTSKETHYVTTAKTNWLMPFRERIAVYYESYTKHTNILCGQKAEF